MSNRTELAEGAIAPVKLDKKFTVRDGDLIKVKDGTRVPDDQWVLFLAKDTAFANTLPFYRAECVRLGCDEIQIAMVDELLRHVRAWRQLHPEKCKTPDAEGEARLP